MTNLQTLRLIKTISNAQILHSAANELTLTQADKRHLLILIDIQVKLNKNGINEN